MVFFGGVADNQDFQEVRGFRQQVFVGCCCDLQHCVLS